MNFYGVKVITYFFFALLDFFVINGDIWDRANFVSTYSVGTRELGLPKAPNWAKITSNLPYILT